MTPRGLAAVLAAALLSLGAGPTRADEERKPLGVVFLGGYGSDLQLATEQFAPLRAALVGRNPDIVVVPYSYTGTTFDGCAATPTPYTPQDTAQNIEVSKRILRETLTAFEDNCNVERIALVGHSLGGLIAFEAPDEATLLGVSDVVTIDSPLGGVPRGLVGTCVDFGLCSEGPVAAHLADLALQLPDLEAHNAAHAAELTDAGIRVSAWGNESDCFYNVAVCSALGRAVIGDLDARETQWLGIPNAVRKNYPVVRSLGSIGPSHTAVLNRAAAEIAAELLP